MAPRLHQPRPDLRLRRRLDELYLRAVRRGRTADDPVEFAHRYPNPADAEVAALVAAALSYGRVGLFKPVVARVLDALAPSPHAALASFDAALVAQKLSGVSYRFNRSADIAALLSLLSQVIKKHGTLGAAFFACGGEGARERLAAFRREIFSGSTAAAYGRDLRPRGLEQLIPDPATGSAAKRMYMFLRWMVRKDEVDLGLWAAFGAENLVVPVDTHVARIAKNLGLTKRRTADYKMALEITAALRLLDPRDPVKYDFAIAHLGISGLCPSRHTKTACARCALVAHCRFGVKGRRAATRRGPRS